MGAEPKLPPQQRPQTGIILSHSPAGNEPEGMPRLDRQHLKASWEEATGLEVAAGQAGEIPAGKQKPKLELEPCRKFGGCLVSQHLVNTSCGWRLTSSSTAPPVPTPTARRLSGGPDLPSRNRGNDSPARRKHSTPQLFYGFGVGFCFLFCFFFPCAKNPEHLFLRSLKFQNTFPAIQTPSWHSKHQYILYNWFFFCCFYHFIKPYNELQRIQHLYNGKTTAE